MGGKFQGNEGCGCEIRHSLWSGQIHYTKMVGGDQGHSDLQDWSSHSLVTLIITVKNGVGTYHGHVEGKGYAENRQQQALSGGGITYFKLSSDDSETSGDGTASVTVDVQMDGNGTYNIQTGQIVTPDGRTDWPRKIGETRSTSCTRGDCRSSNSDIGLPSIDLNRPFSGQANDPNHINASQYDRQDQLGRSRKGVMIQTTSVDLWRSGSK